LIFIKCLFNTGAVATTLEVPAGRALLQLRWTVPPERVEAFDRWYTEEHLPDLVGVPGILLARRFVRDAAYPFASPLGMDFLTLYDVESLAVLDTDEYRAFGRQPSPRTMEVTSGLGFVRNVYRQISPERRGLTGEGPRTTLAEGAAVLHIMTGCDTEAEDDFNRWYTEEHLPRLAEVDGVLHARRFVEAHGQPSEGQRLPLRYLALYELEDAAVASDPAFTHAGRPTPWRDRLAAHMEPHVQMYLQTVAVPGAPTGR
jgi:hypothetical protein